MNIKTFFAVLFARPGRFTGGDGSSFEQAVIISEVNGEVAGIKAEHVWLHKHYPDCRLTRQSLSEANGRAYDQMDIVTKDGQSHSVYFDITSFYGT